MKKKDIRQFYQALYDEVSAPGLTADFDALLDKDWWEEKLSGFLPVRSRFTCREILEACRPGMDLLGTEPEEGWMSFTYRYVCHILYPKPASPVRRRSITCGYCGISLTWSGSTWPLIR